MYIHTLYTHYTHTLSEILITRFLFFNQLKIAINCHLNINNVIVIKDDFKHF